jgi:hypothetical protein
VGVSTDIRSTDIRADVDADRLATGFFERTWRSIVEHQPDAVRAHLAAERATVGALLAGGPYRTVVEAGCADGTLLAPVVLRAGRAYLGLDVAEGAARAATRTVGSLPGAASAGARVLRADVRDLPAVVGRDRVTLEPPVLVALPFNVFGNIASPREALAAVAAVGADVLVLTYDTGAPARRVRAEYYRACGFAGAFAVDATGLHYTDGLFGSSVYRRGVLTGWLTDLGYRVTVTAYGKVGLAYHGRLRAPTS